MARRSDSVYPKLASVTIRVGTGSRLSKEKRQTPLKHFRLVQDLQRMKRPSHFVSDRLLHGNTILWAVMPGFTIH